MEELYFYQRFDEAVAFIERIFEGAHDVSGLDGDVKDVLRMYERKCTAKRGHEAS